MSMMVQPGRFAAVYPGVGLPPDAGVLAAGFVTYSGSTPTLQKQKNVSGVSALATGILRVTFASTLADANYGVAICARHTSTSSETVMLAVPNRNSTGGNNQYSTTQLDLALAANNSLSDPENVSFVVYDASALGSKYLAAVMFSVSGTTPTIQKQKNMASAARLDAGIHRLVFTSALGSADYSMIQGAKYPDLAANDAWPVVGNNSNTAWSARHATTEAVGTFGQYHGGAFNFDILYASALFTRGDDPPPGTLAAASITMSGTSIASSRLTNCSIARQATGIYRLTFTNPLADANYALMLAAKKVDAASEDDLAVFPSRNTSSYGAYSTSQVDIAVSAPASYSAVDPDRLEVFVFDPSAM